MIKVLDTHALMAYLEKEPGYEKVSHVLAHASEMGSYCLMTTVNWGELFYIAYKEQGPEKAEAVLDLVATFPIEIVEVDEEIAKQAAFFKATKKMSYADCFSASLAKLKNAELLTGDPEFKQVQGEVKISWI